MDMSTLVNMLIICWVPVAQPHHADPIVQEAWRIEKSVPLSQCLTMNRLASGGGALGALTVRCGDSFKVSPQK